MRILVVDDEVQVTRSIARLLQRHGYDVRTAQSGSEAMGGLEGVSIVLTDLRMPGMSGLELASAVKRMRPEVRCCLMSGDGGALDASPPSDGGATLIDARLGKPFSHAELLDLLARLGGPP